MIVKYNPQLKEKSKYLRRNATYAERFLWKYLKSKQLKGFLFTRQKPIDQYIVDFFCNELRLIIEIDGISHLDKQNYDKNRDNRLKKLGFSILHFDGHYVIKNITGTINQILMKINQLKIEQPPNPLQRGNIKYYR